MTARLFARFADKALRTELVKTRDARDQARNTARRLFRRLKATRTALETQAALTERWKGIARKAQDRLAEEHANHAKTRARVDTLTRRIDALTLQRDNHAAQADRLAAALNTAEEATR